MTALRAVRRSTKSALRGALQLLAYAIFTLLGAISLIGRLLRPAPVLQPDQVRRILVVRLDLLGDLVMSLPAVYALKRSYKQAEITVLSLPYAESVLVLAPEVSRFLSYDVNLIRRPRELLRPANYRAFFGLVRQLRRENYDLCLSLQGRFACVMAWLSGCPRRYGYRSEAYPFMLSRTLPGGRYRERQHEVLYNVRLAELAGGSSKLPPGSGSGSGQALAAVDVRSRGTGAVQDAPRLTVPPAEQRQVRHWLAEFEIRPERLLLVLHPGASNGAAKRWPPEYWSALADRLHGELQSAVVITGTAAEGDIVREVAGRCSFQPVVLAGQTTIPQLAALLKRADLVISGDTGPGHLAAALGTSVVSIFGPTDPVVYAPFGTNVEVVQHEIWCSPCYRATATAECRFGHVNCMRELPQDQVYQAAVRMLQARLQQVRS